VTLSPITDSMSFKKYRTQLHEKLFILLIISLIAAFQVSAQEKSVLTNFDVIEMTKVGLVAQVIIGKINSSAVEFKTDIESLKVLNDAGVDPAVQVAMIEMVAKKDGANSRDNKERRVQSPVRASVGRGVLGVEFAIGGQRIAEGTLDELKGRRRVYLAIQDNDARKAAMEKLARRIDWEIVSDLREAEIAVELRLRNEPDGWFFRSAMDLETGPTRERRMIADLIVLIPVDDRFESEPATVVRVFDAESYPRVFRHQAAGEVIDSFLKELRKFKI
jgi:hypothetical protein